MTTYNTGNPLGSAAAKDLYDNAENFDHLSNDQNNEKWPDRFGKERLTWHGIEKMSHDAISTFGYITMDSFQASAALTLPNQVLRDTSTGEYYRWDGSLPKTVPAGSTPATSGGVGTGAWISVGDAALRQQINSADGFKLVGAASSYAILKTIVPGYNGQRIQLREYTAGTGYGGGVFVAVNYAYTDDSGIHASVNSSWHWRREFTGPATPEMFGGIPDGGADSVDAINRVISYCVGSGMAVELHGTWKLSKSIMVPSNLNIPDDSNIKYNGTGKLIMAGVRSRRQIKADNHLAPNYLTEDFLGQGGQYGSASRIKGQFEIFAPGTRNDGSSTANEYSINGIDFYNGYYYVCSKAWNSETNGIVNRYAAGGVIDSTYGCVEIPIQHAADCFYNPADGRLYVISGTMPGTVFKLAADGKSVDSSIALPSTWNQTVGSYDKVNNLLFISYAESSWAGATPTIAVFNRMDVAAGPIYSFTMSMSYGVPQGMVVYGGYIYYLVSDHDGTRLAYVAIHDYSGVFVGGFNLNLEDEAEGICVASDYGMPYLVMGVVGPTRLLSIRTNASMRGSYLASGFNLNTAGSNVTQFPVFMPFSLKRESNAWGIHTTINWRGAWGLPVVDSTNKRIRLAVRRNFLTAFLGGFANFQGSFYSLDKCYRVDIAVDSGHYVYFYFRDPATNAYVDPALITGSCYITGAIIGTEGATDTGYDFNA